MTDKLKIDDESRGEKRLYGRPALQMNQAE